MKLLWATVIGGMIQIQLTAAELLVRPKVLKSSAAMRFQNSGVNSAQNQKIEVVQFSSEEEKQNLIQNLNPEEMEWEENQIYSGDDYALSAELQATVKEELKADPLLANQWSLYSPASDPAKFSGVDIDAIRAWSITKGSEHVIVYVMDSGMVEGPEPDLLNRVVAYYDGIRPGQFPTDENSHGTHVASIIGAIGENNVGIKGIVPGKIMIVPIRFLNGKNQGSTDIAIKGIEFILSDFNERKKADPELHGIVNNSWDGGYSAFLEEEMGKLVSAGLLVVTSAGNNGRNNDETPDYPCNFASIKSANICVGATDQQDKRASFSSYGRKSVHVYAPGSRIYSIVPGHFNGTQYVSQYEEKSGTSQAAPHVTGVAALVWSANPKLSNSDVQNIIVKSVDRFPGADAEVFSGGRINAYRAVLLATGQDGSLADRSLSSESSSGGGCSLEFPKQTQMAPRDIIWWALLTTLILIAALRWTNHRRRSIRSW
jgi:subtilisin family serine protease